MRVLCRAFVIRVGRETEAAGIRCLVPRETNSSKIDALARFPSGLPDVADSDDAGDLSRNRAEPIDSIALARAIVNSGVPLALSYFRIERRAYAINNNAEDRVLVHGSRGPVIGLPVPRANVSWNSGPCRIEQDGEGLMQLRGLQVKPS